MDKSERQVGKSRTYQYVKISATDGRYYCLQQKLIVLGWGRYVERKKGHVPPLNLNQKNLLHWFVNNWVRHNYNCFQNTFNFLRNIASYKFRSRRIEAVVNLPVFGQSCMPVHKGHKIFDPLRGVVVKIFDLDVSTASISNEIERLKQISPLEFAPSIRRWNIAERWYEEDYIIGSSDDPKMPPDSSTLLKDFRHELVKHMNSLVLFQRAIDKDAVEYINGIIDTTEISRLSNQKITVKEFTQIKHFLDSMVERLSAEGVSRVFLVLTHGDFCPSNIRNTRYGKKLIDWESASYRSALFDFYSYFFFRPFIHNIPISRVVSEIHDAMPFVTSSLAKKAPEISNSLLHLEQTYRWLYYIERICMLVERSTTDRQLDIKDNIKRYIEIFNRYEEILAVNAKEGTYNKVS